MKNDRWQNHLIPNALCVLVMLALSMWISAIETSGQPTNLRAQQIEINSQCSFGLGYQSNQTLMNYVEPGTTTANFALSTTIFVPPSTTAQAVNLATLFPNITTAILYGVADLSYPGQEVLISMKSDGTNPMPQAAGGFSQWRVNCPIADAPTLYLTNEDADNYCIVKVFCLAQ